MELWVRDKSKTVLQKVERVEYNYRNGLHSVMVGLDSIGTYATQERCLEIIDEIQKLLMSGNPENAFIALKDCFFEDDDEIKQIVERARENKFIAVGGGADIEFMQPNVLVYEMPQE